MFWVNVKRVIRSGFVSFWRNGFVSLASVLIMAVTLFVIGSVIFLLATLNSSLDQLKDKVDINVYFLTAAPEQDILSLKASLEALPEVKSVSYTSRETALANFKDRHQNDALTLQALSELPDNPLGGVLNVKAVDPSQYEAIANFLKSDSALSKNNQTIIDKINYYDNRTAIDRLARMIVSAQKLGFAMSLVLVLLSIIISFNTIRLAIFIARDEISVMRLVGASRRYIGGPFIVSGILYGIGAGVVTLVIFYPLTYWLGTATENFFGGLNIFRYYIANFGQIFGILMVSGICIGAVSSFLAVRRYLSV